MKVAITSQGKEMNSEVDPRFGRARYFIVVETETDHVVHDNSPNLNAAHGAGTQSAQAVVGLGAEAVVTGNIGPKAYAALEAAGVKVYVGAAGSVAEALQKFRDNQLQCASEATAEGHGTQTKQ